MISAKVPDVNQDSKSWLTENDVIDAVAEHLRKAG